MSCAAIPKPDTCSKIAAFGSTDSNSARLSSKVTVYRRWDFTTSSELRFIRSGLCVLKGGQGVPNTRRSACSGLRWEEQVDSV